MSACGSSWGAVDHRRKNLGSPTPRVQIPTSDRTALFSPRWKGHHNSTYLPGYSDDYMGEWIKVEGATFSLTPSHTLCQSQEQVLIGVLETKVETQILTRVLWTCHYVRDMMEEGFQECFGLVILPLPASTVWVVKQNHKIS